MVDLSWGLSFQATIHKPKNTVNLFGSHILLLILLQVGGCHFLQPLLQHRPWVCTYDGNCEFAPLINELCRLMAWNQQCGEQTAPKKTSKAKGKQKATGKDGEGATSGSKWRVVEKKMTHAIKEVKKTSVQEFVEYIQVTVMDDNDLGTGPTIQHHQINLHPIDPTFLEEFIKGVADHGLHNIWKEHAMDVGVHRRDIDMSSLQPAKDMTYSNKRQFKYQKLVREGDYIDGHKDRALIEYHLATNAILPVHQDSEQDSLQMIMNVLLCNQNPDARGHYIENFLEKTSMAPNHGGGQILHFLATPIEFEDVDPGTPEDQLTGAFLTQYNLLKAEFVLDKRYFKDWTDLSHVKMVGSSEKEDQLAPIELFGSIQENEANHYSRYMSKYWDAMVAHAEREQDSTIHIPRDENTCLIVTAKPNKLKVLHYGVMGKILGDKFANQLPIPTKLLLYTLGEQLRSIEPTIKEVVKWIGPLSGFGIDQRPPMWQALHLQTHLPDLEPPEVIEDELDPEQSRFLDFVSQVLFHTSFPWMDSAKLKKSDTLLKNLTHVLLLGAQKKDKSGRWEWLDGISQAPEVNAAEKLDHVEGVLQMKLDEPESNLSVQTQWYLQLHQGNHDKLKLFVHTALSPEFGLGLEDIHCYKGKQLGSGIANLSSLPTFDNTAKALWVAEKNAVQAEEDRQLSLSKQHENVKVIQSARAERVAKVAEMKRARKIRSAPIILDSDNKDMVVEDTRPHAGPSNTTNVSTAGPSTPQTSSKWWHEEAGTPRRNLQPHMDIGSTDMSQYHTRSIDLGYPPSHCALFMGGINSPDVHHKYLWSALFNLECMTSTWTAKNHMGGY
ncbi:hypothetical protein EDC04DRAFT_2608812 [Pisolithus marmoratus]|nr:hypothetical protein EDC04DRAFT_2608812 [Pisolithus marmoratus]